MRIIIFILILFSLSHWAKAQKYKVTEGYIKFYSEEILEDITAVNSKVQSIFNSGTGEIVFSVPISGFEFEKSLMQEHFNEKYMESDKYPKAIFKGKFVGYITGQSSTKVNAEGILKIHGIEKNISATGFLNFNDKNLKLGAVFFIKLVDYNIEVPELMFQKIAEEIEVTIDLTYEELKK